MKLNKAREKLVDMYKDILTNDKNLEWKKSWENNSVYNNAFNPISKTTYHGVNKLLLYLVAMEQGYEDPRWMTFNQVKAKGWSLENAKGKGIPIEFWSVYDNENKKTVSMGEYNRIISDDPDRKKDFVVISKTSIVFNGSHVKGLPPLEIDNMPHKVNDSTPFIDNLIKNMGVEYVEMGNQAYYIPATDRVVIPKKEQFKGQYEYDATRLHELAHATGHESRLNRELRNPKAEENYAREELRAEITASFIAQDICIDISQSQIDNHQAYVQSWLEILEKEPNELFKAIKDAESISDYIFEVGEIEKFIELENINSQEMEEELEEDLER